MRNKKLLVVAMLLLVMGVVPAAAFAQRGGFHGGFGRGHYGGRAVFAYPGFGFGFGYGGWGPYYPYGYWYPYSPYWGGKVYRVDYGTVEFKVKPKSTQVFVDGKYLGRVDELDHQKAYLPGGNHEIRLTAPDGRTFVRTIYVAVGAKIKINEKL